MKTTLTKMIMKASIHLISWIHSPFNINFILSIACKYRNQYRNSFICSIFSPSISIFRYVLLSILSKNISFEYWHLTSLKNNKATLKTHSVDNKSWLLFRSEAEQELVLKQKCNFVKTTSSSSNYNTSTWYYNTKKTILKLRFNQQLC